mgnify:CR=1 FL=1
MLGRIVIKHGNRLLRITLIGPECTGKSTLSKELGKRLKAPVSKEAAREYTAQKKSPLAPEDVEPIARAQILSEDNAIERADTLVIHDTDLLSTCVYCKLYFQSVPEWLTERAHSRMADHYLLCDIDIPWIADGLQRTPVTPEERRQHLDEFSATLKRYCCSVDILRGNRAERLETALNAIRLWRQQDPS